MNKDVQLGEDAAPEQQEAVEVKADEAVEAGDAGKESQPVEAKKDADSAEEPKGETPKGVQKRIDKLTRRAYEAEGRARAMEEHLQRLMQGEAKDDTQKELSDAEYIESLVEKRLAERERQIRAQEQKSTFEKRRNEIFSEASKDEGFDVEDFAANVEISQPMADAILESDLAAKLVLHFNSNPDEASKIARMSAARQAVEIGKLEARLSTPVETKKKSDAPAPIKPVSGKGGASNGLSDDLPIDEWIKRRNKQLMSA